MIGIITYNAPHRKTLDLLGRLLLAGYDRKDLHIVALDFEPRKRNILFEHRPQKTYSCNTSKFDGSYFSDSAFFKSPRLEDQTNISVFIVGGAGILPFDFIKGKKIINAHPGYLPNVRGLDALKWAIYEGQPVGVTTHLIDEKPDEGILIDRQIVPIYFNDTFHSIAQRVYEKELEMLVEAIDKEPTGVRLKDERYKPHRRMTHREELVMMERCNQLIKRSPWA